MIRYFTSMVIVLLFAGVPTVQTVHADTAGEAEQLYRDLFGEKVKQVTASISRADDIELAKQILATVEKSASGPLTVILCDNAYALAMRHPDGYTVAVQAMRTLAAKAPDQAGRANEKLLETLNRQFRTARGDDRTAAGEALVDANMQAVQLAVEADDIDRALALCRKATIIATQIKSSRKDQIRSTLDAMTQRRKNLRMAELLEEKVLKDRSDHTSAEALAKLYIVELDQQEKVKLLASAVKDETLKQFLVLQEKNSLELNAADRLALAEANLGFANGASDTAQHRLYTAAMEHFTEIINSTGVSNIALTKAKLLSDSTQAKLAKLIAAGVTSTSKPSSSSPPRIKRGVLPPPLAVYTFDESTVVEKDGKKYLRDLSRLQQHGEVIGVTSGKGMAGEAGVFSGKGQSIVIPSLMASLANNHTELTVACWAKAGNTSGTGFVFCAGSNQNNAIVIKRASQKWYGFVIPGGGGTPNCAIKLNEWQHVVVSWKAATSTLYVDGEKVSEFVHKRKTLTARNMASGGDAGGSGSSVPRIGTQAKAFGRDSRHFKGSIDELVIYAKALNAQQVEYLYESGKAGVGLVKLH